MDHKLNPVSFNKLQSGLKGVHQMHRNEHFPKIRSVRRARAALASAGTLALLLLSACGEGQGVLPSAPAEATPAQKVAQLEASGAIPQLDRLPTLEGIDANRDGVRDDIALHIEKTYADPAQRRAAMQTARAYQQMVLVNKSDSVALETVSENMSRAIVCSGTAFPVDRGLSHKMFDELRSMTTNTKERLLSYLAYNNARSGSVSRMPKGETCE